MNCLPPSSFVKRIDKLLKRTSAQPKYKEPVLNTSALTMDKSSIEGLRNEIKSLKSQIFNKSFHETKTSFLDTTGGCSSTLQVLQGLHGGKGSARSLKSQENSSRSLTHDRSCDSITEQTLVKFKERVALLERESVFSKSNSVQSLK